MTQVEFAEKPYRFRVYKGKKQIFYTTEVDKVVFRKKSIELTMRGFRPARAEDAGLVTLTVHRDGKRVMYEKGVITVLSTWSPVVALDITYDN